MDVMIDIQKSFGFSRYYHEYYVNETFKARITVGKGFGRVFIVGPSVVTDVIRVL